MAVLAIFLFLAGSYLQNALRYRPPGSFPAADIAQVKINHAKVSVALALDRLSQEQGLSGRQSLGQNEGMLFVFDRPGIYPFWMKDMNFAIDMIWIGEDGRVVYIQKDAEPDSYPATFQSAEDAKYVLEVPSGFSEQHHIKIGDSAEFSSR